MMRLLAFVSLFFIGPALFAGSYGAGSYGAIAYSPSTGRWGYAYRAADATAAESSATAFCGASDCKWIVYVNNDYAAIAAGDGGKTGWAWGDNRDEMITHALTSCAKTTTNCTWRAPGSTLPTPRVSGAVMTGASPRKSA